MEEAKIEETKNEVNEQPATSAPVSEPTPVMSSTGDGSKRSFPGWAIGIIVVVIIIIILLVI